jgi:hypothetical protein
MALLAATTADSKVKLQPRAVAPFAVRILQQYINT